MPTHGSAPAVDRGATVSRSAGRHRSYNVFPGQPHLSAADLGFQATVRALHALGPCPLGELLLELIREAPGVGPAVVAIIEAFARLDGAVVATLGARDWLQPSLLVRAV